MNNATSPDHDHSNPAPESQAGPPATPANPPAESGEQAPVAAAPVNDGESSPESLPDPHGRPPMTPEMKKAAGEIFDLDSTFESLGLRSSVLKGVQAAGFTKPTSIQARLIPAILNGHDVLGQAKTGTGKTAAFGLPMVHLCNKDEPFQGLVLAPTRELAIQISQEINELARFTPIRATTIYGGQAIRQQAKSLSHASQIIVGTPGRIMDMHERRLLNFSQTRFVVLDEVDRMLDIGFREDIRRILDLCPPIERRQTSW
jgi:superfamily II DNA/RNA helicase